MLTAFSRLSGALYRPGLAMLPTLLCASLVQAAPGALNDTGITFCGDETTNSASCAAVAVDGGTFPGQDARYGRDAQAAADQLTKVGGGYKGFDFSKIANNGALLSASAVFGSGPGDWACTKDNVTGLIWEVKTTSGLRSLSHTYTWYNSNPTTNGGAIGTTSGGDCFAAGRCDTEKFATDVNAAGLCGANDWRLPKLKELESVVDFGRSNPPIDPSYFPNSDLLVTTTAHFWSSSPVASNSNRAWSLNFHFSFGYTGQDGKYYTNRVRLVRGGQ